MLDRVHFVEKHVHTVADGELATGALADDLAGVLMKHIAITGQRVNGDQAFDEQILQLDEESETGGADDERAEFLAHAVLHEFRFLPLHQFPLRVCCAAFGLGTFVGDGGELLGCEGVSLAIQERTENAMHHEIGIAANGRSEMRVTGRGQGEMTAILGAVARLFKGPQHEVAEDSLFGFAFDLRNQLLVVA